VGKEGRRGAIGTRIARDDATMHMHGDALLRSSSYTGNTSRLAG